MATGPQSSQSRWYPPLSDKVDFDTQRAFRVAFDNLYDLRDQANALTESAAVTMRLSGAIDGKNKIFHLAAPSQGLVVRNGVIQLQGTDYKVDAAGTTVTFATAPLTKDWLTFLRLA